MQETNFDSSDSQPSGPSLRLRPDRLRASAVLVFSLIFCTMGFDMVRGGVMEGWFLITLFSFAIIASLSVLLPNSSYLDIDTEGITIASSFRRKSYRWQHVERVGIFEIGIVRRVGLDFNKTYHGPERVPNYMKPASGFHITLPTMGKMEPEQLLAVMQECQKVYWQQSA